MKKSSNLVFFGTEDFSAASLQALINDGWSIAAVVTKPDAPRGRSKTLTAPLVKQIAVTHNIRVLQPLKLKDIFEDLQRLRPQIGVLVSYGKIIPASIIDLFPLGIINVHPSLLPKYRGPSPIESAILNGDEQTGISIMRLTPKMDAGPIYRQTHIGLNSTETRPELYQLLAGKGAELLVDTLPQIISGQLQPQPQDDSQAVYCHLLTKDSSWLDPAKPAAVLDRQVRAYLGFPKSKLRYGQHELIVTKARIAKSTSDGALVLACGNDSFLEILELVAPSGRAMSGADFLRGYRA